MESSPGPWISALRHSHDRLRASVEPLGPDQLAQRSYPSEWTIAQVLSHLGSQAEIFGLILAAGLAGQEPPGPEEFPPIWDTRSAKPDGKQRTVRVSTTDPERQFILTTGDEVTLTPSDEGATPELGLSELRLPAEALIRLVYGRLDEAHTPPTESAGVELDELRQIFRGF